MRLIPLRYELHPTGYRVFVLNRRLHHGTLGVILLALGAALALHDRKDWRQWL